MFTLIMLAISVPLVAVAAHFVLGEKRPKVFADVRGIALQTVIIIVVLLAIAGSVAGVLLTRAGDVTSQLESQEVITGLVSNSASCTAYVMGDVRGSTGTTGKCTWSNSSTLSGVTSSRCDLVRGVYTPGATPATTATCVVDIT